MCIFNCVGTRLRPTMHILSYASLQMRNHVQPRLAQCLVYVCARAKPECQGGSIGTLLTFSVTEKFPDCISFPASCVAWRAARHPPCTACGLLSLGLRPAQKKSKAVQFPLCQLRLDKKIVYTSRFVRVILAQGPC